MNALVVIALLSLAALSEAHNCAFPDTVQIKRFDGKNKGYDVSGDKSSFKVTGCFGSLLRVDEVCFEVKCVSEINIEFESEAQPCYLDQGCVGSALALNKMEPAAPLNKWSSMCFKPASRHMESFSMTLTPGPCQPKLRKFKITRCK